MFDPRIGLPDFLGSLRSRVFSTTKAAEYFSLKSHSTIMRYESGEIVKLPSGYLAALTRLVAEQVSRDDTREQVREALLREVNKALLCLAGARPYESWVDLCRAADTYIGRQRLALMPTKSVPKPGTVAPYSRTHRLRPNPLFVGREAALQTIGGWLATETKDAPLVLVISGMAGLGKSQLAVETMHRYGPFFAGGVFWLSFADVGAVPAEVAECGRAEHLAGSYLHMYDEAPHAYLAQLRAARLMSHPSLQAVDRPFSPTTHQQHVGNTIALSYERLDAADPIDALARTILGRIAYFAPGESVPRMMLDETCALDEVDKLVRAIQRLDALALVRIEQHGAVWMHRLIADFVQERAADPAAQACIEAALVRIVMRYQAVDNNSALLALQPHMRWVTDAALPRHDHQAAELCYWLCYHLWQIAAFDDAQPYLEQTRAWLLTVDDAVGRMDLANISDLLGLIFQMQSNFESARTMYEQGLIVRTQALGHDHIETATSHNNLGNVLNLLEESDKAWFHLTRSLQIRRKAFGKEHGETARTLNNLGYILMQRGRFAAAERLFRLVLDIRQRVLPPVAVSTAQTLNNVGDACIAQGNYSEALIYHQQALTMRLQLFGEQHNDSAESYRRLGEIMTHIGRVLCGLRRYDEARTRLEQAIAKLCVLVGAHHEWTIYAIEELCRLEIATGCWAEARQRAEQLVALPQKAIGKAHPRIATAYHLLGQALEGQADTETASRHYERALELALRLLGPMHPQTRAVQARVDALQEQLQLA